MSLIGKYYSNRFNIWVENSYTTILSIEVKKSPIFYTSDNKDGPLKVRSNHTLLIETNTWMDKESKDNGKSPIEFHTYYIPMEYNTQTDIMIYCYNWLKTNVEELKDCSFD